MTFKCSVLNYLWVSDSKCWVNSNNGLNRMLRHYLLMSLEKHLCEETSKGIFIIERPIMSSMTVSHVLIFSSLKKKEYSFSIITLPKHFSFFVCVYAMYVLYTLLIYIYNILAQKAVFYRVAIK